MKDIYMKAMVLVLSILFGNGYISNGGNCNRIILTDDFSSSSSWVMVGDGSVNVSSGQCNFVDATGGAINKVSRNLNATLSDNYWKAECDFSITSANPASHGTGAILMALTAGDLDFMNDMVSETDQDGIAVVLFSDSPYDENINNWKFIIESKKGNIRAVSTGYIYANSTISHYYIRLERTSSGMTQLSVYSDAAFTTHLPGSPFTFAADPTITGLSYIQHGATTAGYPPRLLTATIDNDMVCDDVSESDCSNIILDDDFSVPANWVAIGDGGVNVSNGTCNFDNVSGGAFNKVLQNLNTTLSDDYWKAEFDFSIVSPNPTGHGTGVILIALTAGDLDFINDLSAETNQDGIAAILGSDSPYDENINNWKFIIENKKGNVRSIGTTYIYANSTISNYYIRLERTANGMVQLSVFTDAAFTTHLPGSPITFAADPTITGLNTVQHGISTPGYPPRLLTEGTIDNDFICQNSSVGLTSYVENKEILIYPNPSGSYINIKIDGLNNIGSAKYYIYDVLGKEIGSDILNQTEQINISDLYNGTFIIKIVSDYEVYWGDFQKID
jgi:hypothetical protein